MNWGEGKSPEVIELLKDMGVIQRPMVWSPECQCFIVEGTDPEEFEQKREQLRRLRPDLFFDGPW